MFGYIRPVAAELLVREHEFYKATYCGVCRAMQKHTGRLSAISLSYDSVLLAAVRMLYIPDEDFRAEKRTCVAHPFKKRAILADNEALEYTARAFAILAYHKLRDDAADDGVGKKILLAPVTPVLKGGARKAGSDELAAVIAEKLAAIGELEAARVASVDEPAALFGELLGRVFSEGIEGSDARVLYQFGYHIGKFIYAADAAEDYDKDVKRGKYNPYALIYGTDGLTDENKTTIKLALMLECKQLECAVSLMPFGTRSTLEHIIKNIVFLGLPDRISFLDPKAEPSEENSEKENEQ